MKRLSEVLPKGLTGKLIRFTVIFVFILGALFFFISYFQLRNLRSLVEAEEKERSLLVSEKSEESISNLTQDSLFQMISWASDKVDDEFWILDHDIRVLGEQVKDVLKEPEKYETLSVSPPKKEEDGAYCLQLLAPGSYDAIPEETMETLGKLANLAPMMEEMVRGNEGYTLDCYIALPDGTSIAMDNSSGGKYDDTGAIKPYDATSRPWYRESVKKGDAVCLASHSHFYHFNEAIFGLPVYVDGELRAVLQMSTRLEVLLQKMSERNIGKNGFSILISDQGQLVCSSRTEGELKTREDITEDIRLSVNPDLAEVIDLALSGGSGVEKTEVDGEAYYAGYARLNTIGWTQMAFASEGELHAPAEELTGAMDRSAEHMQTVLGKAFRIAAILMLIIIAVVMQLSILAVSQLAKKRVKPIKRMTEKMQEFIGDGLNFEMEDSYHTGDEIEVLAESFETMSKRTRQYVDEIVSMSKEKERIDAEMEMATKIQESMLPRTFPAFPDRKEFDLYANMVPAKNVGGDFYDFFFVDEDHLALVMADVSGKGITAALFMALSKQVIQSRLLLDGGEVESALTAANLQLIEESLADMFVTVWLGVVTLSTGKLIFVDAGHEYAALRRGSGAFVIEEDEHSMPVAALSFATYHANEVALKPGDMLFLYTDGVPEAHNTSNEMFEMDRLLSALNEKKGGSLKEMDELLRKRVTEFSGEAEQWDDITTLWFRYLGPDT